MPRGHIRSRGQGRQQIIYDEPRGPDGKRRQRNDCSLGRGWWAGGTFPALPIGLYERIGSPAEDRQRPSRADRRNIRHLQLPTTTDLLLVGPVVPFPEPVNGRRLFVEPVVVWFRFRFLPPVRTPYLWCELPGRAVFGLRV